MITFEMLLPGIYKGLTDEVRSLSDDQRDVLLETARRGEYSSILQITVNMIAGNIKERV